MGTKTGLRQRVIGVGAGIAAIAVLAGCGSVAGAAGSDRPNVQGERLDVAELQLDRAGIGYTEVGGGVFGIVVRSHWTVCSTSDNGGSIDLIVARSC